jgi:hypothetical protein
MRSLIDSMQLAAASLNHSERDVATRDARESKHNVVLTASCIPGFKPK